MFLFNWFFLHSKDDLLHRHFNSSTFVCELIDEEIVKKNPCGCWGFLLVGYCVTLCGKNQTYFVIVKNVQSLNIVNLIRLVYILSNDEFAINN